MAGISPTFFWCALQVTLFLTVALPLYLTVRRRDPRAGAAAGAGVLGMVILLSGLAASPWPRWSLERFNRPVASPVTSHAPASSHGAAASSETGEPLPAVPIVTPQEGLQEYLLRLVQPGEASPSSLATNESGAKSSWMTWIAAILAVGIVGGALHLAASLISVRRLIQRSRPLDDPALTTEFARLRQQLGGAREVTLCESTELATPATVGTFCPTILLPATWPTWSTTERRSVLAHELAHIAQHDFAAWVVARAAVAIHFYHPLVRWFAGRLQLDQELAADAAAARLLGDRQEYLQSLASLALATPAHRVAGPVRTFIPGRSLLVRRVEMLRTAEVAPSRLSRVVRFARAACLTGLLVAAAAAAGVRAPTTPAAQAEEAPAEGMPALGEQSVAAADAKSNGYDFGYVPNDALFVIAIRPDQIAASPQLGPLANLAESSMQPLLPFASLSQLTFAMPRPMNDEKGRVISGSSYEYTLIRAKQPFDFKKALTASYGPIKNEKFHGQELMTQNQGGSITFYAPNDRTLISHSKPGLKGVIDDPQAAAGPKDAGEWASELTGPIFAAANPEGIRMMIAPQSIVNQLMGPVFDAAEQITLSTEDGETFVIRAKIVCRKAEYVPRVKQTLQSILVLARNSVDTMAALEANGISPTERTAAARAPFVGLAKEALDALEIKSEGATVTITTKIANAKSAIADAVVPQLMQTQPAVRRAQSQNNLKNLALAALNYESKTSTFPPAIVYGRSVFPDLNSSGDKSAHVPRSWRVELLPLLGQEELYKQYRLDQPWDSEANLKVLRQMPAVYRSPSDQPTSTNASYFAVTGQGTVFDGEAGTPFVEIRDGTSNTLLWVEAKRDIPWTKPEDIAYAPGEAVPAFGGWMKDGDFTVAYCDGSVRILAGIAEPALRQLIERADGTAGLPPSSASNAVLSPATPSDK